jgi:hypothetical protein
MTSRPSAGLAPAWGANESTHRLKSAVFSYQGEGLVCLKQ